MLHALTGEASREEWDEARTFDSARPIQRSDRLAGRTTAPRGFAGFP
jgi:hypothetical protein